MNKLKPEPEVTHTGIFDMQVCVPKGWTDKRVTDFANAMNPCGTSLGWTIRKEGRKDLLGDPERQPCTERKGYVHIMLDA